MFRNKSRKLMLALLLILALAGGTWIFYQRQSQDQQTSSSLSSKQKGEQMTQENDLMKLFAQVNKAMVEQDTETLDQLLTDDMTLTHMTGYVQPKEEWLEQIADGQMRYYSSENQASLNIQISDKTAQLTSQDLVEASIWGSSRHQWRLQMEVHFVKNGQDWQISQQIASTY